MKSVRTPLALGLAAMMAAGAIAAPVVQETFDACEVFTQEEAEKVLGTAAQGEPVNPKVKRPKVIPTCTYNGYKEGKPVAASAQFRFAKTESDAQRAFDEHRLQVQTKPLMIPGIEGAFWSAKTGQMNLRKGRTWLTLSVGPPKLSERDMEQARKLAEVLGKKL
jgi:hypothetical protein